MKNKILLAAWAALVTTFVTSQTLAHFGMNPIQSQLSEEEKTKIESLTSEERVKYFEEKREEWEQKRLAWENVIDKLLNFETLTSEEKQIVEELKQERASQKAKKQEMENQRSQIEAIQTKLKNSETLTTEEQAIIDNLKKWFWNQKWQRNFGGKNQKASFDIDRKKWFGQTQE